MKKTAFASLLAVLAFGTMAPAATVVNNGSFEIDPGFKGEENGLSYTKLAQSSDGWDLYESLPGWIGVGKDKEIEVHGDNGAKEIDSIFGERYVELDSKKNPGLRQTLSLKIGSYTLSFYFSPKDVEKDLKKTRGVSYRIGDLTGTVLDRDGSKGSWTEVTGTFKVAKDGDYDLEFSSFASSSSFRGFVDNVTVAAVEEAVTAVAPVPVPAAGLLLVGALGGLAVLRRRRTAA